MIVHVEAEFLGLFENPVDVVLRAFGVVGGDGMQLEFVRPAGPGAPLAGRAVHKELQPGKVDQFRVAAGIAVTFDIIQAEEGVGIVDPQRELPLAFQLPA